MRERYIDNADASGRYQYFKNESFLEDAAIDIRLFGPYPNDANAIVPLAAAAASVTLAGVEAAVAQDAPDRYEIAPNALSWPEERVPLAIRLTGD